MKTFRSDRIIRILALCVIAAWASLVGVSFADTIEDARKVSTHEDSHSDQAVQGALLTPAVKPASLSSEVIKSHPAFESGQRMMSHAPWAVLSVPSRPLALTLHDPPLTHRFRLFQFLSVYRL